MGPLRAPQLEGIPSLWVPTFQVGFPNVGGGADAGPLPRLRLHLACAPGVELTPPFFVTSIPRQRIVIYKLEVPLAQVCARFVIDYRACVN